MKWVRIALVVYVTSAIAGAYFVIIHTQEIGLGIYLGINACVVGLAVLFERGRYHPTVHGVGDWELTDEKFKDDTTGKWMGVKYNKKSGEREYFELADKDEDIEE
jgi:hypothetical protein